jgi:glycosyltransferase involved in cell wall biosynthesis
MFATSRVGLPAPRVRESIRPGTIVYTEQFYFPEGWGGAQIPRDLTAHLVSQGWRVEVICGSDQYAPRASQDDTPDPRSAGVIVRKTPRLLGGDIHRRKLLKQAIFYLCCAPLVLLRPSPSIFVTQTNPPLLVVLVALAALLHRRPFVIIAQDIYPELLFAHGMVRSNGLRGRILRALFTWSYRHATVVVALSEGMRRRLLAKGVPSERIEIVSNWATGGVTIDRTGAKQVRCEWKLGDEFLVLYSGNIGIAHDVDTPIAAIKVLVKRCVKAQMLFVGKGPRLNVAIQAAGDAQHAIRFRPLVPSSRFAGIVGPRASCAGHAARRLRGAGDAEQGVRLHGSRPPHDLCRTAERLGDDPDRIRRRQVFSQRGR